MFNKTNSFRNNPKLKQVGVKQEFSLKELQEYSKCAEDPIYFIRNYVKIIHVDKGEIPFDLYSFQEKMIQNFINNRFNICKLPRQCGKHHFIETPILTSSGWKTIQDIKQGDYVYGTEGTPILVTETFPIHYGLDCYELKFSNGETLICSYSHLWDVEIPDYQTLTTKEIHEYFQQGLLIKLPNFKVPLYKNTPLETGTFISTNVFLRDIKPVNSVPVKCISVGAENQLYLCGKTMIPTHNSISTCAYLLHSVLFKSEQNIAILANKQKTSAKLLADLHRSYMSIPLWMQQGIVEWNKLSIKLENGSQIMAAATSADSIRGNSFNTLVLDEFAFVPAHIANDFFESVYPTISSGDTTKVIIISTPKGQNRFHKMWTEANNPPNDKDFPWNGYVPFSAHWSDVPTRDKKWYDETVSRIGLESFTQEFSSLVGESYIQVMDKHTKEITSISIKDLYDKLRSN